MAIDFKRFLKAIGIKNATDMSKQLVLQVSDSATTATTTTLQAAQTTDVTITLPNVSGTLLTDADEISISDLSGAIDGRIAVGTNTGSLTTSPSASLDANGQKISNVANPTLAQDVATKDYVDNSGVGAANQTLSNLTNPTAINQNLVFNKSNAVVQTGNNTATQALTVKSGDASAGISGNLTLATGDSSTTTSGIVTISGGNSNAAGFSGGRVFINGGDNSGSGIGGSIRLEAGSGNSGAGGAINVVSGGSTSGNSGDINISTAASTATRGEVILSGRQINASSVKIVNVATPTTSTDAATKGYVDSIVGATNSSFRAASTGGTSFSTTETQQIFQTQNWNDFGATYNTGTGTFTVATPGKYQVRYGLYLPTTALTTSQRLTVQIRINGAAPGPANQSISFNVLGNGANIALTPTASSIFNLSATDTIAIFTYCDVSTNISAGSFFDIIYLGA